MEPVVSIPTRATAQPIRAAGLNSWKLAAWLSGAFTLSVALIMFLGHLQARDQDPLNSPKLKNLKEELRKSPADEALKQQIRALDLQLRESYFGNIRRTASGVWLLLAGAAVFCVTAGRVVSASKKPFLPCLRKPEPDTRAVQVSRFAVAGVGALAGAGFYWLAASLPGLGISQPALPASPTASFENRGPDCATAAELALQWPAFRGLSPGHANPQANPPAQWDATTGKGVAWKVESPIPGFNSPLIFNEHVYFSGGDASALEVVCLKLSDGQVAWRQALQLPPGSPGSDAEIQESTGYAPSTMATDGRRVYAIFANGYLGAFTLDGKQAWAKAFGALKNPYGHAISLITWQDRLIVQLDQGESDENKSMLYAFDGPTGRPVWQRPRKVGASWASPILIETAGKTQVITLALPSVIAYSITDGSELWRAECLNGEVTPSPAFAAGLVLVASPSDQIVAIRPDGTGDVSKSHIAWSYDENIPDVTSPASDGERVFFVTTSGTLTCLDIKDGSKLWEHELEMECHASPVIAGNRVYQFGQDGTVVVLESAREYKEVFKGTLPDSFHATPSFTADKLVLRGMTNIWCLTSKQEGGAK